MLDSFEGELSVFEVLIKLYVLTIEKLIILTIIFYDNNQVKQLNYNKKEIYFYIKGNKIYKYNNKCHKILLQQINVNVYSAEWG